jgi:hypothetical protein
MTKVFQKYLSNIFISIVQQGAEWVVYSKVVKNGVLKEKFSQNFDAKEYESIPVKMEEYLDTLQTQYNFAYLALFLESMGQGAFNGTTAVDFKNNSVDIKSVTHFDLNKKWSIYASFIDINWAKKLFKNVGIDFIYSPFIVQYSLIKRQKTQDKPILYMLNHQDSVTITVFDDKNLLFGAYFKTTTDDNLSSGEDEDWENAEEEEGIENITELDSMDGDSGSMEELEDLSDLDDLSSNDSISFEDMRSDENDLGHFEGEDAVEDSDLELFGRDILIYKYLTSSLKEFYQNPLYNSSFIDTVIIYDGYEVSAELIDMIEGELLMDIEMNKIDISETICKMAKEEALT